MTLQSITTAFSLRISSSEPVRRFTPKVWRYVCVQNADTFRPKFVKFLGNIQGLIFSSWLQCIGDIDGGNL